ncbi:chemotaxis protein CheX [Bdellovibrionota bacterium FG-2]
MAAQIDFNFLTPFIEGASKALRDLCNISPRIDKVAPASEVEDLPIAIAGVIGITGAKYRGAMTIGFPKEVFLHVMSKMLGEDYKEITPDLADGAAELSNIVFGQAKMTLNQLGHNIQMALPNVVMGKEVASRPSNNANAARIIFETAAGPFMIEFVGNVVAGDKTIAPAATPAPPPGVLGAEPPKLDGKVLMTFVDGIKKAMTIQFGAEPKPLAPYQKTPDKRYQFDIGGMIGVNSNSFGGTFAICFAKKAFIKILESMMGEPVPEITREHEDAATEIVNITFGEAKRVLNEKGYGLEMAIPTIIRGKEVESLYPSRKPPIVLPFEVFDSNIWIEFAFGADAKKKK